jgi:hypothetical protein
MKMRLVLATLLAALAVAAWASEAYTPPPMGARPWERRMLYLAATAPASAATGACLFACDAMDEQWRCQVYLRGLDPGAGYTLWLLPPGGGPQRLSSWWRPLRPDPSGVLTLVSALGGCPAAGTRLVVRRLTTGRARDPRAGEEALAGRLWQAPPAVAAP